MSTKPRKIAIVGTGHVGSHVAFALATQGVADELYMVDIDRPKAKAQSLDINDSVSYLPHHVEAKSVTLEECGECDLMYISAGPLPSNMTDRLDSLAPSIEVMNDIIPLIKKSGFKGIIISITNPADVIATYLKEKLDWPANRIISTGCGLDSARLQRVVSEHFGVGRNVVSCYAMGEHGGSAMVPWSHATVAGIPLSDLEKSTDFTPINRDKAAQDMRDGGFTVLAGKGSTEFGIGSTAAVIARAILHNEHKLLPCSCFLTGQYGIEGIHTSVPAVLGQDGVENIIEINMPTDEMDKFNESCQIIRKHYEKALNM